MLFKPGSYTKSVTGSASNEKHELLLSDYRCFSRQSLPIFANTPSTHQRCKVITEKPVTSQALSCLAPAATVLLINFA